MNTQENTQTNTATTYPVRLLVLDDDTTLRELVQRVFETEGWYVTTAIDGREGLQCLLQEDFDVALVDLCMEGMDGLAFLQEARKIWPWLGIVVYSGYLDAGSVARAKEAGVTRFVSKPTRITAIKKDLLDEMNERKASLGEAGGLMFSRMQYQLNVLRRLTESALKTQSLMHALRSLSEGISELLACNIVGVLGIEDDERILYIRHPQSAHLDNVEFIQREMITRYEALSGKQLDLKALQVEIDGPHNGDTPAQQMQSITTVPVISGKQVHGVLTLAAYDPEAFGAIDVSFLYHAANHLSSVLTALTQLHHLAIRDPLTGLHNRRHLEEVINRMKHISQRYDYPMSILLTDLDYFKEVNDSSGHDAGDKVLIELSEILTEMTRASDIVARYGGDEFVIVLPHANEQEAAGLAARLMERIRAHPFQVNGRSFDLSLSVGIATIRPHRDYIETQDILKRADQALYRAKGNGRDRYIIWQDHDAPTPASPPPGALNEEHPATKPLHIMVVDDKPAMTRLIAQFLQELPCEITCAHTVQEALGLLHKNPNRFGIVLTDLTMPDADGFELLDKIHALDKTIVRIVISGYATADNAILAMRHGAYDFIPKPFMPEQLRAVVGRAMEYRRLLSENLQYGQHLEEMVEAKSREASRALEDIKTSYEFTILTMVAMLDARERETSQHSRRVSDLTRLLAYHMGVHDRELDEMGRGALVHDIGKIGIPDNILNKPGPLNEEEWKIMRTHPDIGYQFLRNCSFLRTAAEMVLQHHEAYNGTGYPKGLKGEEISLGARIFMVVDTYDTMRSARVYKKSMPATTVLREIIAQRGRQFDPHVVDALVNHQHEIERAGQWPE